MKNIDPEAMIALMIARGYIVRSAGGRYSVGTEPPADEDVTVRKFWLFLSGEQAARRFRGLMES